MCNFREPCAELGHSISPEILPVSRKNIGSYRSHNLTMFGHGAFVNLTANVKLSTLAPISMRINTVLKCEYSSPTTALVIGHSSPQRRHRRTLVQLSLSSSAFERLL